MKKIEHEGLELSVELVEPLLERNTSAFFKKLKEETGERFPAPNIDNAGAFVRAAVEAEILEVDADELKPGEAAWLAFQIDEHVAEAFRIPPE